jgi:ubiquinone/menaquinone biosynthesis C-methylase UbiE
LARAYQYNFSSTAAGTYDDFSRKRKAKTMVAVLEDFFPKPLSTFSLLNIGGSTGIIDNYLADYFQSVISVDIDGAAIRKAQNKFQKCNLEFQVGDALNLQFKKDSFHVVICSPVSALVPSP